MAGWIEQPAEVGVNHYYDPHAGCVVTIYDSAAGIDANNILAIIILDTALYTVPTTLTYDIELNNGLYVEFDVASTLGDITISYI